MTTKNDSFSSRDKTRIFVNEISADSQYSNLNLNQNSESSGVFQSYNSISSVIQTKNNVISFLKTAVFLFSRIDHDVKQKTDSSMEWSKNNKSLSEKPSDCLNIHKFQQNESDQEKINTATSNNSTLSLHIAAYENSVVEAGNNNKLSAKKNFDQAWDVAKNIITETFLTGENSIEFPRQQKDEKSKPEVMQFKSSQRLFNPNQSNFVNNAQHQKVEKKVSFVDERQKAMATYESQLDTMSQKLLTQELRIKEKALDDLKKDYEQLKIREQTLMEKTRWEQGRTKAQEDKVKSLNEELEKLKDDYENVMRERDNLKKEIAALRRKSTDNTFRLQYESEIINYRAKIAGLESRLSRRQVEFEKSEEFMRREMEKLQTLVDNTQIRLESSASFSEKENLNSSSVEKLNDLHFKIGDLTATNKALRDEINRHVSEKSELQEEMKGLREEMESLKGTNNVLQERLTETEGSNDFASKYHTEEITKIKAQKAEIRCELIRLRREHEKCSGNTAEDIISKANHEKEVAEYKKKIADLESKLHETKRVAAENESSEKGQIEQLTADLKKANAAIVLNQEALQTLDKQAEDLVKRVQLENASKKAAKKKVAELETEVKEFKRQIENKKMMEEEMMTLKVENDKLLDKIAYLENEIRETHTDHREELAKLAQQVTKAHSIPSSDSRQTEELTKKVAHLEATIRQNENVARSLQRQIDQSRNEVISAEKALSDMREKQCTIVNENTDLRRALHEALVKLQTFKANEEKLKAADIENKEQIDKLEKEISNLQDEIAELRDELNQKEENIAYLQSIQQPRKLEKLKITHSQSTLVTGADDELEYEQLIATRDELARQVNERTRMLEKKKEEIVPLLKASSVCSESSVDINQTNMSANSSRSRIGTMRHDIPHRWSKTFVAMFSPKCEMCYEAVARFSYAHRCKSCHLVVHSHCKSSVLNTCGLPAACANFYQENHSLTNDRMSGWVKIWQADESSGKKWCNAFAIYEGNILAFYESDLTFSNSDGPFFTVDLSQERWKIFNQTGTIKGIEAENAESLIEIKLQNESLFMLAATPDAKRNWIRAFQNATNRRILDRNGSNRRAMSMSTIVRMGKPLLKFQCTEIYHDWLLIGTPQGLFATIFSNPRQPFQLAGFSNLFQMKWVKEYNLFFAIDGVERNVVVLHGNELEDALHASSSPRVHPTPYSNLAAAHLIELSEPQHASERYLYVATSDGITVFHYMSKKDMFVHYTDIKLEIPAMCIISCPGGFVFGSDTFYFVPHSTWSPQSFRTDWPPDCPIGVVKISDEEILIVNHNCGVFTTPQGKRTRPGIVEWERVPISVTYCEPFLFIVYTDMISIARVIPYDELQEGSPLIEELEGYRAPSARVTGYGKSPSDILITVMNDNCVELNSFSTSPSLKRKTTTTSSLQSLKKRF